MYNDPVQIHHRNTATGRHPHKRIIQRRERSTCLTFLANFSERVGEYFDALASAKRKSVYCSEMFEKTINDNNVDTDHHAICPPDNRAGGDSKLEELCQQDSLKFVMTANGASPTVMQLETTGRPGTM